MPGWKGRPRSTSGRQNQPRSARITRTSWASAHIAPAAKVCPVSAATVTTREARVRARRACTRSRYAAYWSPCAMSHARSSPFDQYLPSPAVTSAHGPSAASTSSSARSTAPSQPGWNRFSLSASRRRTKTSPSRVSSGMAWSFQRDGRRGGRDGAHMLTGE
ncbi:hypothetical protein GA0115252_13215 [Streptomyces sp. DfronAA-171]|nr:hypothetical protein GA0115252_13215 [Streptomyces sp. DfronAA-171]